MYVKTEIEMQSFASFLSYINKVYIERGRTVKNQQPYSIFRLMHNKYDQRRISKSMQRRK